MVIIVPRGCGEGIAKGLLILIGIGLLFAAPIQFMGGIGELIFGSIGFWSGLVLAGSGLVILIPVVIYGVYKDRKARDQGERYLTIPKLSLISIVGLIEIIIGLVQPYDGTMAAIRFMLVGGGCITLMPAGIYLIIVILREKSGKPPRVHKYRGETALEEQVRLMPENEITSLLKRGFEEASPTVASILNNGPKPKKMHVLWELGTLKDKRYVPLILSVLDSYDPDQRRRAADVLGKIGDKSAIKQMKQYLQNESDFETSKRILTAIETIEKGNDKEIETDLSVSKNLGKQYPPVCCNCGQKNLKEQPFCTSCGGKLE